MPFLRFGAWCVIFEKSVRHAGRHFTWFASTNSKLQPQEIRMLPGGEGSREKSVYFTVIVSARTVCHSTILRWNLQRKNLYLIQVGIMVFIKVW